MDLQAFFDKMSEMDRATRAKYHLTLGGLRDALAAALADVPVVFDDDTPAGSFDSYRGYYTDIAIDAGDEAKTVSEWRDATVRALSTTFYGYKGGDYPASPNKPLWRPEYGQASGLAIVGAEVRDAAFVLVTKQVD